MRYLIVIISMLCISSCNKSPAVTVKLGLSMVPTFASGQEVEVLITELATIKKNSIVAINVPKVQKTSQTDFYYVLRILAVEGDELNVVNNHLYINGDPATSPNNEYYDTGESPFFKSIPTLPFKLSKNSVFVLGDNPRRSADSRIFGPVANHLIYRIK